MKLTIYSPQQNVPPAVVLVTATVHQANAAPAKNGVGLPHPTVGLDVSLPTESAEPPLAV